MATTIFRFAWATALAFTVPLASLAGCVFASLAIIES